MQRFFAIFLLSLGLSGISGTAWSTPEGERRALAQLLEELSVAESLINKAEAQSTATDQRIRFQYQWLREDIAQIKAGIAAHLNAPRAQPRSFPPLRGDYRR